MAPIESHVRPGFAGALRDIGRLAPPLALVQLGQVSMGLVDTAVVGHLGEVPLAAVGLGSTFAFFLSTVGLGIALATEPLAAQAFGAGDPAGSRRAMRRGILVGLLISLPVFALLGAVVLALPWLGVEPAIVAPTRAYLLSRIPGFPPLFAFVAVRAYLQATKRPRPPILATIVANVVNLVADWLLVHGDAGLVRLGLPAVGLPALHGTGAGIVTSLCFFVQLAVVAAAVRTDRGSRQARDPGRWREAVRWASLAQVFRIGVPIGLQIALEAGVFTTVAVLMAGFGASAAAAHQITINLASASFSVVVGIGSATGIVVGHHVGARSRTMPAMAGGAGLTLGVGVTLLSSMLFLFAPELLARLFTSDPGVVATSVGLLRIAGAFQLVDGTQAIASGALRGAADTAWPFAIHALSHWGVGFTTALLFAYVLGMGGAGLWWGLTAGLAVAAVLLVVRFFLKARRGFDVAAA